MTDLDRFAWPAQRLGEALELLARRARLDVSPLLTPLEPAPAEPQPFEQWLANSAARLRLETEAVTVGYAQVNELLAKAAPALLQLPGAEQRFLLLAGGNRWRAKLLAPDLSLQTVANSRLEQALSAGLRAPYEQRLQPLLAGLSLADGRRAAVRDAILREQLAGEQLTGVWLLRQTPAAAVWRQLGRQALPAKLGLLLFAHAAQQGLQIVGWWLIVRGALNGQFDTVWLLAWALVMLTAVPLQLLVVWLQSLITVGLGSLLKQRLLFGTLQLRPEEIRHQGIGQFLGRVLEAETVETMMLGGGFNALIAVIELAAALVLLGLGAGGWPHAAVLVIWLMLTGLICFGFFRNSRRWRISHRLMINDLIERMVGHRTRLAQQNPQRRHDDEDQSLANYLQTSRDTDANAVQLRGLINRGWLLAGLVGLAHALLGDPHTATEIALSLGGIMLAAQGLNALVVGADSLIGVANAWGQIGPLFKAAGRGGAEPVADHSLTAGAADSGQPLLLARDLAFAYPGRHRAVLSNCNLAIRPGDRLLLEGSSGGGKSTLAALLTGLRRPTGGLLLMDGLDQRTLGAAEWRRRAVAAPQFHENHVLTETFAFNLLMGRQWPPSADDLAEAETVCRELGLADLLEKMPAGLQQMVGESGWQLSHGERSRLFIARALLQRARLITLDESFAALDPVNLERALRCVLARAPTLLVIAHP